VPVVVFFRSRSADFPFSPGTLTRSGQKADNSGTRYVNGQLAWNSVTSRETKFSNSNAANCRGLYSNARQVVTRGVPSTKIRCPSLLTLIEVVFERFHCVFRYNRVTFALGPKSTCEFLKARIPRPCPRYTIRLRSRVRNTIYRTYIV